MPTKKTISSTANKVKATSPKAAKPAVKKVVAPAKKAPVKAEPVQIAKPAKVETKPRATRKATAAPAVENPIDQTLVIPLAEIELRAYFISERRQTMGWLGDSSTDWIEAEAQLLAEAKRRLKKSI